jgi:hypothetical protein
LLPVHISALFLLTNVSTFIANIKMPAPLSVETMEDDLCGVLSIPQTSDIDGLCVPASTVQEFVGRDGHVSLQESNSIHRPKAVCEWQSYIRHLPHHLNKIQLILSFLYIWIPFGLTISSFCGNFAFVVAVTRFRPQDLPFLYHRHTQPLGKLPSRLDQAGPAHPAHLSVDLASKVFVSSCIYLRGAVKLWNIPSKPSRPMVTSPLYITMTSLLQSPSPLFKMYRHRECFQDVKTVKMARLWTVATEVTSRLILETSRVPSIKSTTILDFFLIISITNIYPSCSFKNFNSRSWG